MDVFDEEKNRQKQSFSILPWRLGACFPSLLYLFEVRTYFGEVKEQYRAATGISETAIKKHNIDFMLASSAIVENMILVSNDNIFRAIEPMHDDFQLENWTQ